MPCVPLGDVVPTIDTKARQKTNTTLLRREHNLASLEFRVIYIVA
jgi:hypothetical protein